jgi:hypothetical protein
MMPLSSVQFLRYKKSRSDADFKQQEENPNFHPAAELLADGCGTIPFGVRNGI